MASSYSTTWSVTNQDNASMGGYTGNSNTKGGFSQNNGNWSNSMYCYQLQYKAWHTRVGSNNYTIHCYLDFNNGTRVDMGTQTYNGFTSAHAISRTYTKTFNYTTNPTAVTVGTAVRSGFKQRYLTWSPANQTKSRLYYRGTSGAPITVQAWYYDYGNSGVKYYNGSSWVNCIAYYCTNGSSFTQTHVYYGDENGTFHKVGF